MEVGEGDLEEAIERDVDHLVIAEFFGEGFGAEFVVAIGAGEEVGLHPCAVGLEGFDDGGVGFGEGGLGVGVGGFGEGGGDVSLEEADDAVDLFEGDLGVDLWRIFQVLAGFEEGLGDLFFALDGGAEAGVGGGVGALHDDEDGVGDAGGVVVGVLLPGADDLEGEEGAADVVEEDGAVTGDGCVEGAGVDCLNLLLVGVEGGDLFLNAGGGVVLELGVVLMEARGGAVGGAEVEVDVGEVLVGEEVEGLDAAVGGEVLGGCGCQQARCEEEGGEDGAAHWHCNEFTAGVVIRGWLGQVVMGYVVIGMTPYRAMTVLISAISGGPSGWIAAASSRKYSGPTSPGVRRHIMRAVSLCRLE